MEVRPGLGSLVAEALPARARLRDCRLVPSLLVSSRVRLAFLQLSWDVLRLFIFSVPRVRGAHAAALPAMSWFSVTSAI